MTAWHDDDDAEPEADGTVACRAPLINVRLLAEACGMAGVIVIAVALAWWFAFFSNIPHAFSSAESGKTVGCLVYTSGVCNLATLFGASVDAPTYNPTLLWVGVVGKVAKWVLQAIVR